MHAGKTSAQHVTVQRLAALSRVCAALMSERDEARLFQLIVETASDLLGATFAALTLRPMSAEGEPLVPSEGHLFQLAAIVGVPPEQEAQLRRMPLGGEGLLLPIFRYGVPVRRRRRSAGGSNRAVAVGGSTSRGESGRSCICTWRSVGRRVTRPGRPAWTSLRPQFPRRALAYPTGEVRGGLLLGHSQPGRFRHEDEIVLAGLVAQAAVALEQVRWYRTAQMLAYFFHAKARFKLM